MQAMNIQTIQAGGEGFRHLQWYADTAYVSGQISMVKYAWQSWANTHQLVGANPRCWSRVEQIGIMEIKIGKRWDIIAVR
jgi:hypothetical protein